MIWGGFGLSMELYNPDSKVWTQAHYQARFVITKMLLETAEGLIKIEETEPGKNLRLTLNKDKIETIGRDAMKNFLLKLQIYKSTGDIENALKFYDHYSKVDDNEKYKWASWRNIVLMHKKPRLIYVIGNTEINNEKVTLKKYNADLMGYLNSWTERFDEKRVYEILEQLYEEEKQ